MIDARVYHQAIASAIVLALGIPALAQDAASPSVDTPVSVQEGPSESAATPSNVQDAVLTSVDAPVPAMDAALEPGAIPAAIPEAVGSTAPAQQGVALEPAAIPAPTQDTGPEPTAAPPTAPDVIPEHIGKAARARRATRSTAKDAEADQHTPRPVKDAAEPDHVRGQITAVDTSSIELKTADGQTMHLGFSNNLTVIKLAKGSFTTVDFGVYVGSVALRLEAYSPIVRDSLSWLHKGFELRIVDEQLRGIALGHKQWDVPPEAIIAHGWVDDIEGRVLSIKWGPTEEEETDVEVPRDVPVLRMSLGDKNMIKPGAQVFAGAQKDTDGNYTAVYMFVGKDGIAPPL
jgi:hypothetical protein